MALIPQEEIDKAFELITKALDGVVLPTQDGNYRKASADEFMLMDITGQPQGGALGKVYRFKHRYTRNYLYLTEAGGLIIYKDGSPFHKGYFDNYGEDDKDGPGK